MINKIRSAVFASLAAGACVAAHSQSPIGNETFSFDIPAEDSEAAIRDFGLQSGITILAKLEDVRGIRTNEVSGKMSVDAALRQLTAGTGLHFSYSKSRTISVSGDTTSRQGDPPSSTLGHAPLPSSDNIGDQAGSVLLEEIVVSAQRRNQNLQSVPISSQVIEGRTLIEQNLNSLDDLSESILPSVHVGSNSRSANLYVRGTGSGESQNFDQSVGIFEDDLYHGRARMSDVMLFDLDRIEILKGPQTTFFGNNAIAGAFNIVTKQPTNELD